MARTKAELQFDTFADFPVEGSANILYIATDTLVAYIWDGNSYEPIGGGGGGSGDVTGPASSTDQNIAVFNGITGKIIEDGGIGKDTLALICNDQHAITNYTFDGTERRNGGYLCNTTSANTTVNINADLFDTGTEFIFCKGVDDAYTVTLDAGAGNNINGSQTIVMTYYNEFIQLIKDGANTWKAIQTLPKNSIVTPTNTVALTNKDLSSGNTFPTFNQNTTGTAGGLTGTPSITVSTIITTGSIEVGHATDTTLSRSSAGVLAVEGVVIPSISSTNTLTNKTIDGANNTLTIREADLSLADNTTNNASSTKHGFLPKLDNTGTKYLRDDGAWQTVSGGGLLISAGNATAPGNTSGTTYTHGLGQIPKMIRFSHTGSGSAYNSEGYWDGSVQKCVEYTNLITGVMYNRSSSSTATISNITSTEFTITWNVSVTGKFIWVAYY